ncbi:MAG: rRNA maturation RNase YbeY [Candidatus Nanopelagicaceae bacterium]|nr:rRNA maturation RNase YbeY [Candidatus Nanopelagicaceae bacterium]
MTIDIENRSGVDFPEESLISLLSFGISELDLNPECDLNVLLVDEAEMTALHIKWMDEPGPTDVLSFPMDEIKPGSKEAGILGDIVLCPTIAQVQAKDAGHDFDRELSILSVHGLLHIVGYDHATPKDEKMMFTLQESIVDRWKK